MTATYHNTTSKCTANVPSWDGTAQPALKVEDFLLQGDALQRLQDVAQRFGSQRRMAQVTGIRQSTPSQILAKGGDVTLARIAAICAVCNVSIEYILTGQSPEPEQTPLAHVKLAIASAEGFAVAIDCLPVGKDIRNRLQSHIQAHIYLLRLASGDPA